MRRRLLSALLALVAVDASAAVKCVNTSGSGGCFNSIQAAVTAAAPGDTVSISAGTYYENVTIPSGRDGLVLLGASKLGTIVDGSDNALAGKTGLEGVILTIASNNVQVKNFTLRNSPGSAAIDVSGNAPTLLGLRLLATGRIILQGGVTNAQIVGNEFRAVTSYAVQALGSNDGTTLKANRVYAADDGGFLLAGNGILVTANVMSQIDSHAIAITGTGATVTYNTISSTEGAGIAIGGDGATVAYNKTNLTGLEGISVSGGGANVHHNSVRYAYDDGIYVAAATGAASTASFNSVYDAEGKGVYVQAAAGATASSNRVTSTESSGVEAWAVTAGAVATANLNVTTDTGSFGVFAQGFGGATATSNRVTNAASAGVFTLGQDADTAAWSPATASLNVISGVNGYGIENYGAQATVVRNNLRDVQGTGIYTYCFGSGSCTSSLVQYNVVTGTGAASAGNDAVGIDTYTEGPGRIVSYNVVTRATSHAFWISGSPQTVTANRAFDQGADGDGACFLVEDAGHTLTGNQATRCSENGFRVTGDNNTLTGNTAFSNWGNGIEIRSTGNTLTSNRSTGNTGAGVALYVGTNTLTSNVTGLDRVGLCDATGATVASGNTFPDGTTNVCEIDK